MARRDTMTRKTFRQRLCNCFFSMKAIIAIIAGIAGLAIQGYKVRNLYNDAAALESNKLAPVIIDPAVCTIDPIRARLEPPDNTVMVGFHLDWSKLTPAQVRSQVGFTPAVFNAFLQMDPTRPAYIDYSMWEWHAQQVRDVGGILAMTIEPSALDAITDDMVAAIAQECLKINSDLGVPMFLRWGHEMNGDWTSYGMQPISFKSSFRRVAIAVHAATNMTAMVWGPNLGINYPFSGGGTPKPLPGTPDFIQLDTTPDGILNSKDDPYLPYYPGDDVVDWVGMSLYYYPDKVNSVPGPTYFRDCLTCTGDTVDTLTPSRKGSPICNFYQRFVVERNKPMMIPETAAPTFVAPQAPGAPGDTAIKSAWYSQIFSKAILEEFPRLKVVTQFEEMKSDGKEIRDWRIIPNANTLNSYKSALTSSGVASYGSNFKVTCGGVWQAK